MRFYEIDAGRITLDGVDIARHDTRRPAPQLRHGPPGHLAVRRHDPREHRCTAGKGATEEEIVEAAESAHVDHFVRTLTDGYDTVIDDERAISPSGEKQLLTIARAFLADPKILILDEATSSVDTRTEVLIQRAMSRLMSGRTTFVIAHRLSTIRDAELIVVGSRPYRRARTHDELLAKQGFYHDLYQSQFAGGPEVVAAA